MKHTKEEIINALKVIKDECSESHCESCPFGNSDERCKIEVMPSRWTIGELPPPETWRALK